MLLGHLTEGLLDVQCLVVAGNDTDEDGNKFARTKQLNVECMAV